MNKTRNAGERNNKSSESEKGTRFENDKSELLKNTPRVSFNLVLNIEFFLDIINAKKEKQAKIKEIKNALFLLLFFILPPCDILIIMSQRGGKITFLYTFVYKE